MVIMPVLVCLLGLPLTFGSLDLAYARSLNTFDVMDALEAPVNVYDSFCLSAETARTAYRFFGLRKRQRRRETACPRAHNILSMQSKLTNCTPWSSSVTLERPQTHARVAEEAERRGVGVGP